MTDHVPHSLVKRLRAVPDFEELDDRTLLRLVGASANLVWHTGSLIFEKGSPADALYIVITGRVCIFDVVDGRETEVAQIEPDGFFGELSLFTRSAHSKGARALEDTELMVIEGEWFEKLLESEPKLAGYFRELFMSRNTTLGAEAGDAGA